MRLKAIWHEFYAIVKMVKSWIIDSFRLILKEFRCLSRSAKWELNSFLMNRKDNCSKGTNDETWLFFFFQMSKVQSAIHLNSCSLVVRSKSNNGMRIVTATKSYIKTHMPSIEYCINISIRYTYVVVYKNEKPFTSTVFKLQTPTCLWLDWWL